MIAKILIHKKLYKEWKFILTYFQVFIFIILDVEYKY